eukprot:TRINITY_DN6515_c0_g2_i5.p1 TRINITY_DN6515_c0_g2~~TRINITY_DN6515_c0_g2_i5.p1  ORF type:complete len:416 (+),score=156.18 TRINITY_DN6515_c0_g2_i5:871-2118(+)
MVEEKDRGIGQLKADLKKVVEEKTSLKEIVEEKDRVIGKLMGDLKRVVEKNRKIAEIKVAVQREIDGLKRVIEEKNSENEQMKVTLKKVLEEKEDRNREVEVLKRSVKGAEEAIRAKDKDKEFLRQKLEDMKEEMDRKVKEEKEKVLDECDVALRRKEEEKQRECEEVKVQLTQLLEREKKEGEDLKQAILFLERDNKILLKQVGEHQTALKQEESFQEDSSGVSKTLVALAVTRDLMLYQSERLDLLQSRLNELKEELFVLRNQNQQLVEKEGVAQRELEMCKINLSQLLQISSGPVSLSDSTVRDTPSVGNDQTQAECEELKTKLARMRQFLVGTHAALQESNKKVAQGEQEVLKLKHESLILSENLQKLATENKLKMEYEMKKEIQETLSRHLQNLETEECQKKFRARKTYR